MGAGRWPLRSAPRLKRPADLAASFNEFESRVVPRLVALANEGRIKESTAAPERWMIA